MTKSSLVESKIEKKVFSKCGNPGCWTCSNCRERFTLLLKTEMRRLVGKKVVKDKYDSDLDYQWYQARWMLRQEILDKLEKI